MAKKWIAGAVQHPGALHKALHVPAGHTIPASKLAVAAGDSPHMKKKKQLAKTFRSMH